MNPLAPERVGPYVRALNAAVDAVAPDRWHVSPVAARAHLRVLDPDVSGEVLLPGGYVAATGMPEPAWMERAIGAQRRARREGTSAVVPTLDALLQSVELLSPGELRVIGRRLEPPEIEIVFDRLLTDGRWERVRAELRPSRRSEAFALTASGNVVVEPSVRHLLARTVDGSLSALHDVLADVARGEVLRLGRAWVGPFWFPGVLLPEGVPAELGQGLVLHAAREALVRRSGVLPCLDPLAPGTAAVSPPPGTCLLRTRRFSASPDRIGPLRSWLEGRGIRAPVAVLRPFSG